MSLGLCESAIVSDKFDGKTYRWSEYFEVVQQNGAIVGLQEVPKCGLAGAGLTIVESDS